MASLLGQKNQSIQVTLPHDAMINEKRDPDLYMGNGVGSFPYANVVYTKEFELEQLAEGSVVWLEFEGIYMNLLTVNTTAEIILPATRDDWERI